MNGTKQQSTIKIENNIQQTISEEVKGLQMSNPTFCFFCNERLLPDVLQVWRAQFLLGKWGGPNSVLESLLSLL